MSDRMQSLRAAHVLRTRYRTTSLLWLVCLVWSGPLAADDARVLPAGVTRVHADYYAYLPVQERYSPDGEREAVTFPFESAALDSTVFTALAPLDALVGGRANLGNVSVEYDYDIDVLDLGIQHGVTDRLTIGAHIPWYRIRNDVATRFDSSTANVGLNPATGACCLPIAAGGQRFTTENVQNLITSEFGYARVESWRREGFGDLELGGRYQLVEDEDHAVAVTAGLRVPTGYADDPDSLTDLAWSFGNYALLFRAHLDYRLSSLWRQGAASGSVTGAPDPGDVVLNATLRYDLMLPDRKTKRIGDTPDQVFTSNRERVRRKLGDRVDLEFSMRYQATAALSFTALYRYGFRLEDRVSGNMGFNYSSLEADTDSSEHVLVLGMTWSTVDAWRHNRFPIPVDLSVGWRDRFAGRGPRSGQTNTVLHTRWLVVGLKAYF